MTSAYKPLIIGLLLLVWGVCPLSGQSRAQHQEAAQVALQSQLSREGKDCPDVTITYYVSTCFGKVLETTHRDFDVFYQNLKALLAGDSDVHENNLAQAQRQWLRYRKATCEAIGEIYRGGTIRPSAEMRCDIQLTRSRMRDLANIYIALHN